MLDSQAQLEHRLTSLEEKHNRVIERLDSHDRSLGNMDKELKDIVKLLSERPTWLTTALITVLTTVTASLVVYVVTSHH